MKGPDSLWAVRRVVKMKRNNKIVTHVKRKRDSGEIVTGIYDESTGCSGGGLSGLLGSSGLRSILHVRWCLPAGELCTVAVF